MAQAIADGLREWASNSSSSAASPTRSALNAPPSSDEPQNPRGHSSPTAPDMTAGVHCTTWLLKDWRLTGPSSPRNYLRIESRIHGADMDLECSDPMNLATALRPRTTPQRKSCSQVVPGCQHLMPAKQLANFRFMKLQELSCFRVLALCFQQYADRSLTTNLPCGNRRLGSDLITRQKAAL